MLDVIWAFIPAGSRRWEYGFLSTVQLLFESEKIICSKDSPNGMSLCRTGAVIDVQIDMVVTGAVAGW